MKPQEESKKKKAPLSESYYENEPKAQLTFKMVECGILSINNFIEKATVMVGMTKAGKTTSSHYMTGQVLVGGLDQQKQPVYNLKSTKSPQLMKFKIAQLATKSQTQIPNFFPLSKKQFESSYLIDSPGYVDSEGCFRIISNRFFHYQVFSKVEKMKFIITVSYKDMLKLAQFMTQAFKYFLKGFLNLMEIKQQIFAATCLLVTNTPNDRSLQDVINLYSKSPSLSGELNLLYQQLKKDLISKKKIFIFNSPKKEGQTCNIENKLLSQIESSLKYWQRKVDLKNNEVDMRNINFGLLDFIDAGNKEKFQQSLGDLWAYYDKHIQSDFKSLISVLQKLAKDCQSEDEKSFTYLKQIISITQKKEQWVKNSCKECKELSKLYLDKKNKAKKQMFALFKQFSTQSPNSTNDGLPIWAAKLKALMNIQKHTKQFVVGEQIKNYEECYQIEKEIKKVFNQIYNLSRLNIQLSKKNSKDEQQKVLQFCYFMLNNFQISNKMYRLMAGKGTDRSGQTFVKESFKFILHQYPNSLKTISIQITNNSSVIILLKTFKRIKFVDNMTAKQANQTANFMEEIKQFWEKSITQQKQYQSQGQEQDAIRKQKQQQQKLRQQFHAWMELNIIALANISFLALKKSNSLSLPHIKEIEERRKKIMNKIKSAPNSQIIQQLKAQNNRCIQLIAECLYKHNKLEQAASLFDLIFDAYKVFEILDAEQVSKRRNKDMSTLLQHLIKYSQKADKYLDRGLAIKKAQQAYHIAQQMGDSQNIKKINSLIEQIDKGGSKQQLSYKQYLNKKICEIEIPPSLSAKIMNL